MKDKKQKHSNINNNIYIIFLLGMLGIPALGFTLFKILKSKNNTNKNISDTDINIENKEHSQDPNNIIQNSQNPNNIIQNSQNPSQDPNNIIQNSQNANQNPNNIIQNSQNANQNPNNIIQNSQNPSQDPNNIIQNSQNQVLKSELLEQIMKIKEGINTINHTKYKNIIDSDIK